MSTSSHASQPTYDDRNDRHGATWPQFDVGVPVSPSETTSTLSEAYDDVFNSAAYADENLERRVCQCGKIFRRPSDLTATFEFHGIIMEGPLLQTAIAVVTFPRPKEGRNRGAAAELHLKQWRSESLPDYTKNMLVLHEVECLLSRLEKYMIDFVGKATSSYLPAAYLQLPGTAAMRHSLVDNLHTPATLADLTDEEFTRLIFGFLRHEMYCKIVALKVEPSKYGVDELFASRVLQDNEDGHLCSRGTDVMKCVHVYFRTLLGTLAHAARLYSGEFGTGESDLPASHFADSSDPMNTMQRPGLYSPDDSQFYPVLRLADQDHDSEPDLMIDSSEWLPDRVTDGLVFRGVEEMDRLMATPHGSLTDAMRALTVHVFRPNRPSLWNSSFMDDVGDIDVDGMTDKEYHWRRLRRAMEISEAQPRDFLEIRHHWDIIRIYRQRAWALFDDARLYPANLPLPTWRDVRDQVDRWPHWYGWRVRVQRIGVPIGLCKESIIPWSFFLELRI
ncbi:hypothetical protein G7046_g5846 [Stylonectria norvegica]|nr:hypothetical protein G7046_g5846 [Stylonectria norvegica]